MRRKKPESITIIGKRWFDRVNGNTYHSVQILIDGLPVHQIGRTYGSDQQYLQTAKDWLVSNGYLKARSSEPLFGACQRQGIALHDTATDVKLKGDL